MLLLLLLAVDLIWIGRLQDIGEALVTSAYGGRAPGPLQGVFDIFASDSHSHKTPLTCYITQYQSHYLGIRLSLAFTAILAAALLPSAFLPALRGWLGIKRSAMANPAL